MLDQGKLVESGEPHTLLQHNSGIFTGMVSQTGPTSSSHLREVARMASFQRAASRNALALQHQQLRIQSEVLGRRYVDNPVQDPQEQQQQQHMSRQGSGADEDAQAGGAIPYNRTDSGLGSRWGLQVRAQGFWSAVCTHRHVPMLLCLS